MRMAFKGIWQAINGISPVNIEKPTAYGLPFSVQKVYTTVILSTLH